MKPNRLTPIVKYLLFVVVAIGVYFACLFAFHGDIVFHTDIARDFLLMEDVVKNKPIILIGPRSGGIPGVFHGPLWTYLNLPAYLIGGGSPAVVGWFWVILYLLSLVVIFKVAKRIINEEAAWMSTAIVAVTTAFSTPGLFNPYGAVILSPLFLYFLYRYFLKFKVRDLLIALFTLGLIIQFQIAFGGPILALAAPLIFLIILKKKKYKHLAAFLILLIPLSTYILFDLKNHFLQIRSLVDYMKGKEYSGVLKITGLKLFQLRLHGMIFENSWFIAKNNLLAVIGFFGTIGYGLYRSRKERKIQLLLVLIIYFYIGYWALTLMYSGTVWSYYYWPFLPILAIALVVSGKYLNKILFLLLFLFLLSFNLTLEYKSNAKSEAYYRNDASSWLFQKNLAETIFKDAPKEFGYYIYTADQFGYSPRFAMDYVQDKYKQKKAAVYIKKPVTYLIIAKNYDPSNNHDWWRANRVNIAKKPVKIFTFKNNFVVEKYELTPEELKVPSDQNLIHTLIFR